MKLTSVPNFESNERGECPSSDQVRRRSSQHITTNIVRQNRRHQLPDGSESPALGVPKRHRFGVETGGGGGARGIHLKRGVELSVCQETEFPSPNTHSRRIFRRACLQSPQIGLDYNRCSKRCPRGGCMNRTNPTFILPIVISVVFAACNETEQTPAPSPAAALNPAPTLSPFQQSATTAPRGPRWEEVARWGDGADGVEFNSPNGIAIDAEDRVYTTEFRGHRVQKFTPDGVPVGEWGGPGTEPGQLTAPTGIVVGPDGRVYVTESGRTSGPGLLFRGQASGCLGHARRWVRGVRVRNDSGLGRRYARLRERLGEQPGPGLR